MHRLHNLVRWPYNGMGSSTPAYVPLSTSATWLGTSWIQPLARTLAGLRFYCSAFAGTASLASLTVEIQGDVAGGPDGTAIATATMPAGTFSSAGWYEATFSGGASLLAGITYWAVFKPVATDYPTIAVLAAGFVLGDTHVRRTSTDSGTTYGSGTVFIGGILPKYTDGTYYGLSSHFGANSGVGGPSTYLGREGGAIVQTPDNMHLIVRGVSAYLRRVGAAGGNIVAKLYVNGALVATSETSLGPLVVSTGGSTHNFYFANPVTIPPKSDVRIVVSSDGGDISNYCYLYVIAAGDIAGNTPNARAIVYQSGTWTIDPNIAPSIGLLCHALELAAPPLVNRRTSTGR